MAEVIPETWESHFQGKTTYGVFGSRDVLILVSDDYLAGPDIQPRKTGCLTEKDKERLLSEGIPQDIWHDEAKLFQARHEKASRFKNISIENSPGLCTKQVLDIIGSFLKTTKQPGAIIIYIGPGRKGTGDWCYSDGFIKFEDIIQLYNTHFTGRELCLELDCSYAGTWTYAFMDYMDKCNISPCLHSAKTAGKLLSIAASCRSNEVPYSFSYIARGLHNDKNTGFIYYKAFGFEVAEKQHILYRWNSTLACKNNSLESCCSFSSKYNWKKKRIGERLFLIRYTDVVQWELILVDDDDDILDQVRSKLISPKEKGVTIRSGDGEYPSTEVKEWMNNEYPEHRCF